MGNLDFAAIFQAVTHSHSAKEAVLNVLAAVGGLALLWTFIVPLIPRLTLALLPWAMRLADALATFLLANPWTGPMLRRPEIRDKALVLLDQLEDMLDKLVNAFKTELKKDLAAPPQAPPAAAPAPAAPTPPPGS